MIYVLYTLYILIYYTLLFLLIEAMADAPRRRPATLAQARRRS